MPLLEKSTLAMLGWMLSSEPYYREYVRMAHDARDSLDGVDPHASGLDIMVARQLAENMKKEFRDPGGSLWNPRCQGTFKRVAGIESLDSVDWHALAEYVWAKVRRGTGW